jgi:hypothetical protein
MKTKIYFYFIVVFALATFSSCEDYLDRQPLSTVAPEVYFKDASLLQAYADDMYHRILPTVSSNNYFYGSDAGTDNQVGRTAPGKFFPGYWKVPNSGGDWWFENIYRCNFFFNGALPRFGDDLAGSKNTIAGNLADVQHYIGEMYFLRAFDYFKRYSKFGDFPIITEPLADNLQVLTNASKRSPRNEVARFILSDLDKAAELMKAKDMATTRINRDLALLFKSRVALYEATWLKYFKGTAFVPNGEGWPGKTKDYNANYQFPSGSIDDEINWFLDQSMSSAKEVSEKYKTKLTANTGILQQSATGASNPYYDMYIKEDLSKVSEVLLWRQFAYDVKDIGHDVATGANQGNWAIGVTRGFVQNFLMADGSPVYTHGTYALGDGYYMGDTTIRKVRQNRDSRLSLFLKEPGQINVLIESQRGLSLFFTEPYPDITTAYEQKGYTTGYAVRKGAAFDSKYIVQNKNYTGVVLFRAAEALLNYMEASYERNGSLDASAREYWQILRRRALVSDNIDATIAATDMSKEAENDWGAYSGGQLVNATLYNIRRERRCEFISEGLRNMDLSRWRAMDQMITTPFIPEGMHLWNTPMQKWYKNLVTDGTDKANVSSASLSEYIRPYQRSKNQKCYDGFVWKMAHYLDPIMIKEFQLTSPDGTTISESPIYQNPYWPTVADQPAEQ